jgi:hypothetical protein
MVPPPPAGLRLVDICERLSRSHRRQTVGESGMASKSPTLWRAWLRFRCPLDLINRPLVRMEQQIAPLKPRTTHLALHPHKAEGAKRCLVLGC